MASRTLDNKHMYSELQIPLQVHQIPHTFGTQRLLMPNTAIILVFKANERFKVLSAISQQFPDKDINEILQYIKCVFQ